MKVVLFCVAIITVWVDASITQPTTQKNRCQPDSDGKVECKCADWTSKQICSILLTVDTEKECDIVGGVWGHDARDILSLNQKEKCLGNWNNKPFRRQAEFLYQSLIEFRNRNNQLIDAPQEEQNQKNEIQLQAPHSTHFLIPDTNLQQPVETINTNIDEKNKIRNIILAPSFGPSSGGVWVQVSGAGSLHTPNSLQCKLDLIEQFCYSNHYYYTWCYMTPKCAGVYDFTCHNGPFQFQGKYAVVAKTPWVTSVYPFSGDVLGGTSVTVRGWNFEPHCPSNLLCRFGSKVVQAKYYTSSSIICISPCHEKGFTSVEVSNDGGAHWSMSGVQFGFVGNNDDLENPKVQEQCQKYTLLK
eukprot:c7995_g1_i1.p1 GENE.c7995_g1_i1~~c7995_g1_i1.p1  ORF type:complete len:357 (-),score=108.30 c7995_g1_i1:39-1109(-)